MHPTNRTPRLLRAPMFLFPFAALLAATVASAGPAPAPAAKAPDSTPAPVPAAASGAAPAAANAAPTAESLKPALPMEFSAFAPDFQATTVSPPWLTVQVGTLETFIAPPLGKSSFVIDDSTWNKRDDFIANFHPIEISCLVGAKARYDNVTLLNLDKTGHPLGYTLPLGQIVYFVARGETEAGVIYSLHYYDSGKDLFWVANPEVDGAFIPVTRPIVVTQDLGAPLESYTLLYLSQRVGTARPDSTSIPLTLYTYLVIHVHSNPLPAAPTGIVSTR